MHSTTDPSLRGRRILIVDDDKDTLTVLDNVLSERGATVIAARSAAAALDVMSSDQVDVLISDIGMPGQDGYELMLKIVAARKGKPMLPAIALTGYASQKDRERALAAGYNIHMVKPFEPADIVSAVERLLSLKLDAPKPRHAAQE
jgi:CheY-like chemotaxis protein